MDQTYKKGLEDFKNYVGIKFQLYNSLFTALPFHRIEKTGILLSLFLNNCEEGYKKNLSPTEIIEDFFSRVAHITSEQEKNDLLFRLVQYVERQVVLFDALEDSAFAVINDVQGGGSLKHLQSEVEEAHLQQQMIEKLKTFSIHLVLTAHPTQFYPDSVLGIIHDLAKALKENQTLAINSYLQQLGKTPFFKKEKPTPYDEAISLVWYLENVFYHAAGRIARFFKRQYGESLPALHRIISLGFWPGGDRDGNPNVTPDITRKVAEALRSSIIKCYYIDVRKLKRRLTFVGVDTILAMLEQKLYNNIFIPGQTTDLSVEEILGDLQEIRNILIHQHNSLFIEPLESLIAKVELFGLHFASIDIRQDSSVHENVLQQIAAAEKLEIEDYVQLTHDEKMKWLATVSASVQAEKFEDAIVKDTIGSLQVVKEVQKKNGESGCHRYIISHSNSAVSVMEVYALFRLCGWQEDEMNIDIIPLFETVDDLKRAPEIMKELYENESYHRHLQRRKLRQVIMVGFSDGTKDGGYLMANWSIYKAKEELSRMSKEHGVDVVFFDGRGGPPARGGGKTHKFYASMGKTIAQKEIQLTIQGQTISSNFGTVDSAQYNIEQLLNAGISGAVIPRPNNSLTADEEVLMNDLALIGHREYQKLKNHPYFTAYLEQVSPLKYYSETNIASRPARRKTNSQLSLNDLRAIPFVGAWSQLKQNVPGYFGVGSALKAMHDHGKFASYQDLYRNSQFFATLIDNCEMAMKKSFFPLTSYLANDPDFGEIWNIIHEEYLLTMQYVSMLTGKTELMANYPVEQLSIQMRERIVLPLTTIQQYALRKIREAENRLPSQASSVLEKLVIRTSFGIINAVRNSA